MSNALVQRVLDEAWNAVDSVMPRDASFAHARALALGAITGLRSEPIPSGQPLCSNSSCREPARWAVSVYLPSDLGYALCCETHFRRPPGSSARWGVTDVGNYLKMVRGLCRSHYDRGRKREPKTRADKVLESRARNRATARLVRTYAATYDAYYSEELSAAQVEAAEIDLAAPDHGHKPRLRPGPAAGDSITERIREVGSCGKCQDYHDRGHRCAHCGSVEGEPRRMPVRKSPEERIAALLQAGKTPSWIRDNTGEPVTLIQRVLTDLRRTA